MMMFIRSGDAKGEEGRMPEPEGAAASFQWSDSRFDNDFVQTAEYFHTLFLSCHHEFVVLKEKVVQKFSLVVACPRFFHKLFN